jgi:hypothetical protein
MVIVAAWTIVRSVRGKRRRWPKKNKGTITNAPRSLRLHITITVRASDDVM